MFARAPVDGSFLVDVLPSMILLGFGAGIAFNPVLLAAMGDVEPQEAGLASGIVNTVVHDGRRARPRRAREHRRVADDTSRARATPRLARAHGRVPRSRSSSARSSPSPRPSIGALLLRESEVAVAHGEYEPAAAGSFE